MLQPSASTVRARILGEHQRIRLELERVDVMAGMPLAKLPGSLLVVQSLGLTLLRMLEAHLDLEDAVLLPALRDSDPSGPARAEILAQHHEEQRYQLRELLAACESPRASVSSLAAWLTELAADLREDMEYEESHYLSEDVLRDDVVGVAVEAG